VDLVAEFLGNVEVRVEDGLELLEALFFGLLEIEAGQVHVVLPLLAHDIVVVDGLLVVDARLHGLLALGSGNVVELEMTISIRQFLFHTLLTWPGSALASCDSATSASFIFCMYSFRAFSATSSFSAMFLRSFAMVVSNYPSSQLIFLFVSSLFPSTYVLALLLLLVLEAHQWLLNALH